MKKLIAIIITFALVVVGLVGCKQKSETTAATTKGQGTTVAPTTVAPTTTADAAKVHEHENNGFICLTCGEEFVEPAELDALVESLVTAKYGLTVGDLEIPTEAAILNVSGIELAYDVENLLLNVYANISFTVEGVKTPESAIFLQCDSQQIVAYIEDANVVSLVIGGSFYPNQTMEGAVVLTWVEVENLMMEIVDENEDEIPFEFDYDVEEILADIPELLDVLEEIITGIEERLAQFEVLASIEGLAGKVYKTYLTLLERAFKIETANDGTKSIEISVESLVAFYESLNGKTVAEIMNISELEEAVINGYVAAILNTKVEDVATLIDLMGAVDAIEAALKEEYPEVSEYASMVKDMYEGMYPEVKDLSLLDIINMAIPSENEPEPMDETEEEPEEAEGITVEMITGMISMVLAIEIELPEVPEEVKAIEASIVFSYKELEVQSVEVEALGYSAKFERNYTTKADYETAITSAVALFDDYSLEALVEALKNKDDSYELILEGEEVVGVRTFSTTGRVYYYDEEYDDYSSNWLFEECVNVITEYYLDSAVLLASTKVFGYVSYEVTIAGTKTYEWNEKATDDIKAKYMPGSPDEYADRDMISFTVDGKNVYSRAVSEPCDIPGHNFVSNYEDDYVGRVGDFAYYTYVCEDEGCTSTIVSWYYSPVEAE